MTSETRIYRMRRPDGKRYRIRHWDVGRFGLIVTPPAVASPFFRASRKHIGVGRVQLWWAE